MSILNGGFYEAAKVFSATTRSAAGEPRGTGAGQEIPGYDALAEDVTLYLRHVEGGESIRAIARSANCHASTILRRIRKLESRRDDPLVDEALTRAGVRDAKRVDRRQEDQTRRVLRRLAEPEAELIVATGMPKAIVSRGDIRTAILDRQLAEKFALERWIEPKATSQRIRRYIITPAGRVALRRLIKGSQPPERADFSDATPVGATSDECAEQHRSWQERELPDPEDGRRKRMRVNLGESPLQLLARRRDARGKPFLTPDLVAAGERLREDFELAQMGPRVTQNWDRFMTAGIDESPNGGRFEGGSDRARARVAEALRELGPGMGDLVLRVCCFLEGLELTERRLGWSARSGKIVLRLALERLARHYEDRYGPGAPLIG